MSARKTPAPGSIADALALLLNDPRWASIFATAPYQQNVRVLRRPSWPRDLRPAREGYFDDRWSDVDDLRLTALLERRTGRRFHVRTVSRAVRVLASRRVLTTAELARGCS